MPAAKRSCDSLAYELSSSLQGISGHWGIYKLPFSPTRYRSFILGGGKYFNHRFLRTKAYFFKIIPKVSILGGGGRSVFLPQDFFPPLLFLPQEESSPNNGGSPGCSWSKAVAFLFSSISGPNLCTAEQMTTTALCHQSA